MIEILGFKSSPNCRLLKKIILILSFAFISFVFAQDSLNVKFLGGYPFGRCSKGLASGVINNSQYVFVSSGSSIMILNTDDPSHPVKVGQIITPIKELFPFLVDTLLYIAAKEQGLWIYNVSDPSNPVKIGGWQSGESILNVFVRNSLAYVISYTCMTILDISNPSFPIIQGEWVPDSVWSYYVYVKDDYAYVCAACAMGVNDALIIIDISNTASPFELGRCYIGQGMEVVVKGDYAYVTGWGLRVVDISDPTNPHVVNSGLVDFPVGIPLILENYLFVGGMEFYVFDISVPDDPLLMAQVPYPTSVITILNDYLYSIAWGDVYVLNITEPFLPFYVGGYEILNRTSSIQVSNNFAIFDDAKNVFRIINITDPQNCYEMGKCQINYPTGIIFDVIYEFVISEDYFYVAAYDSGMRVIDISDPANPEEVGHCYVPGYPGAGNSPVRDVSVQGDYAYLGCGGARYTFAVVNVSNPAEPFIISLLPSSDTLFVKQVFALGNYVYCTNRGSLGIIDITNPSNPHVVGRCSLSTSCIDIYVSGNYAYLGDYSDSRFWIVDVSNPYNPVPAGYYSPIRVNDIFVQGDYAYLSNGYYGGGIRIFDVSNPSYPHEVGYYKYAPASENGVLHGGIYVVGEYIYTAATDCGLWILEFYGAGVSEHHDIPIFSKLKIISIADKIEFSYSLSQSSPVKISLIDICGRIINKTITRERAGKHMKKMKIASESSGIYFLRVETNEWVDTRKIVLIK